MSEKLTRDRIHALIVDDYVNNVQRGSEIARKIMQAIEADREAIRAEEREELLKDHFKMGERVIVELFKPQEGIIGIFEIGEESNSITLGASPVSRPVAKTKRPMTREELIRKIHDTQGISTQLHEFSDETLKLIARDLQVSTEVEE